MKWMGWVSGLVLLGAVVSFPFCTQQPGVTFHHLQQAKARLAAAGFICTVDSAGGKLGSGFLISREAMSWCEVGSLCKTGAMGPQWTGKAWVTTNPANFNLETLPDRAATRAWGDVVAFGDDQFLAEIDAALAESPTPVS
jgi:hypothetical protein